jgi:Tfp pilus assembly protein PilP
MSARYLAPLSVLIAIAAGAGSRTARAVGAGGSQGATTVAVVFSAGTDGGAAKAGDAQVGALAATSGSAATAVTSDAAAAKRVAALRHKVLKDEDFIENEDSNRDPFHAYLRTFVDHVEPPKTKKLPSAFEKVGLEDLTLIAVVTGGDTPRAMFRDATGYGQSVKRGDFLSRSGARVTKILSDRVIVEITETTGAGEPRVVEKAILVNPDEPP